LQEELPSHALERDRGLDQPVLRLDEIEDAGNAEFGGEFRGAHRKFLSSGTIIADRGATKFGTRAD
jgi:hypothetical protein